MHLYVRSRCEIADLLRVVNKKEERVRCHLTKRSPLWRWLFSWFCYRETFLICRRMRQRRQKHKIQDQDRMIYLPRRFKASFVLMPEVRHDKKADQKDEQPLDHRHDQHDREHDFATFSKCPLIPLKCEFSIFKLENWDSTPY